MKLILTSFLLVGTLSVISAQDNLWSTSPIYRATSEKLISPGKLRIYEGGLWLGEPDASLAQSENQKTPLSTIIKLYNAQTKANLEGVFYDAEQLNKQRTDKIKAQFDARRSDAKIYVESILFYNDPEGHERAFVKLYVEKEGLNDPIYVLKALIKKDEKYTITSASLLRGLGIAFLSVKTSVFANALKGEDESLPILNQGSVSLIKFSSIVNEWMSGEEDYSGKKLQNLEW